MIQLSDYGERVVDRLSMLGNWLAVIVSIRNFFICYHQYRRTRGKIHCVNIAQVVILGVHRFLYGIIPIFEITTCDYYPLLISFWHISYILYYVIMFMRLIILESDRHSLWIKAIGITLIAVRFADWPYELTFQNVVHDIINQQIQAGGTCWVQWGNGVIIFNFVGDSLANLFLSGMFVRRLYLHIRMSKTVMSRQNRLIEHIARKSLMCLIFTFIVNLAMNLLKITEYIGDRSDAFTVYFQLIESTLLVEALRVEGVPRSGQPVCENCGLALESNFLEKQPNHSHNEEGANPMRSAGTNESIFRELSFFDASLYNDDMVLRDTNNNNNDGDNEKGHNKQSNSPTMSILSPKPMQQPAIPPPVASTISSNNAMDRRRPLSLSQQHPEWSNNDYRMF